MQTDRVKVGDGTFSLQYEGAIAPLDGGIPPRPRVPLALSKPPAPAKRQRSGRGAQKESAKIAKMELVKECHKEVASAREAIVDLRVLLGQVLAAVNASETAAVSVATDGDT